MGLEINSTNTYVFLMKMTPRRGSFTERVSRPRGFKEYATPKHQRKGPISYKEPKHPPEPNCGNCLHYAGGYCRKHKKHIKPQQLCSDHERI